MLDRAVGSGPGYLQRGDDTESDQAVRETPQTQQPDDQPRWHEPPASWDTGLDNDQGERGDRVRSSQQEHKWATEERRDHASSNDVDVRGSVYWGIWHV